MKILVGLAVLAAVLVTGCVKTKPSVAPHTVVSVSKPVITPDFRPVGSVLSVNPEGRFVVINYSISDVPKPGQLLSVYRDGLKVGELKVTGPQRDGNTVADILSGEAQARDEAREQ